eukprot:TRINITY_DN24952_c0_g2_i1.p1 TRINITY_DN24952_c0_g2~~TRINITY_DN24952_c0_g2_i1.p1  ORF type:complete len:336 (+),score=47.09 TRINITY_DN24952_c0_g2_i1:72-1079(+)
MCIRDSTNAGLELADDNSGDFRFHVQMILSFIAGSTATGLINPHAKPYELGPHYGPTFLLGAVLLIIASIVAEEHPTSKAYYYLAAATNGLQNAMSSTYSANLIRSTHLTGTSTDIGIILGQVIRGNNKDLWKLYVLLGLATCFFLGSFTSFFAVREWAQWTLIFNSALFTTIGLGCIVFVSWQHNVSLLQAATGNWTWEVIIEHLKEWLAKFATDGQVNSSAFLEEMFDIIDHTGCGFIDQASLLRAMLQAGVSCCEECVLKLIKSADENGDGKISREEWRKAVASDHGITTDIATMNIQIVCDYCDHKRCREGHCPNRRPADHTCPSIGTGEP